MKNLSRSKTPLAAVPGLSDEEIIRLKACGVRTWEEYCAYAHTYSGVKFAGSEQFRSRIGDTVFNGIINAKIASRAMGCIIPDASLSRMKANCCESFASEGTSDSAVGDFEGDDLPHEIRLMGSMPAIRDQGMRGTCTAFASVALCEFAEGCEVRLSPQFLYWASKERDGKPSSDGTSLDTVQETLFEDGVCRDDFWPYNPKPLVNDEGVLVAGQGPAPEKAVEEAKAHKLACRTLSPNAVRQYRKILADGIPVVIGVATFDSWTANPMTAETGWVPMPYMKKDEDGEWQLLEEPKGGHAMCIVGYVDDRSWPGGGYFIVRNSWSEDWASECDEGAGHALIPYRYIAFFTHSAFTLVEAPSEDDGGRGGVSAGTSIVTSEMLKSKSSVLDSVPVHLRPFARVLKCETRDFRGALLPVGSCVLSLLQSGSPIVEYSPKNFATPEYRAILAASRFPDKAQWGNDLVAAFDSVLRRKQEFCAKVEENLSERNLCFKPFPEFKFSWNIIQVLGARRIWSSSVVADFSDQLFDALLEDVACGDGILQISAEWRNAMKTTVSAKIRKVSSMSFLPCAVYVVEVFANPFGIDSETGICQFARPTARLVDVVKSCAANALGGKKKGRFIFYSIGTGLPLAPNMGGDRDGECAITVSGPSDNGSWEVRRPGYLTGRSAYRDFSDRLMPVTREDIVSAVKAYVDGVDRNRGSLGSGKVTVGEIVEHLHGDKSGKFGNFPVFRQSEVIRVLLQMQGNAPGKYVVCQEKSGSKDVFVIPAAEVQKGDQAYKGRGWFANLLLFHSIHFLGLLISSAFIIGKSELEAKMGWGQSFLVRVLLAATTMCVCGFIQSWFNRLMSTIERD